MNNDYNDERWLKRANEIRKLDGYKCAMCGKSNVELHVHHLAYPPKPFHIWDATDDELVTLCKDCHRKVHHFCESRPKLTTDRILQEGWKDMCWKCIYYEDDIDICEECGGGFFRSRTEYYDSLSKWVNALRPNNQIEQKESSTKNTKSDIEDFLARSRKPLSQKLTLKSVKIAGFSIHEQLKNNNHD